MDLHALLPENLLRLLVTVASRRVRRTVGPIASHTEDGGVSKAVQTRCSGQGKLLIAPPFPFSGQVNDGLTPARKARLFFDS